MANKIVKIFRKMEEYPFPLVATEATA